MKLKPKHFEVASTISYFVDRNYYPNFNKPTREQINIFTQIESRGSTHLTNDELYLVKPLLNGKEQYDLQIKMIHQELKEWVINGWGWWGPIDSIFSNAWKDRKELKTYIKFLIKLIKKLKSEGSYPVLLSYSGFSDDERCELLKSIVGK